jgi:hypothetical protein
VGSQQFLSRVIYPQLYGSNSCVFPCFEAIVVFSLVLDGLGTYTNSAGSVVHIHPSRLFIEDKNTTFHIVTLFKVAVLGGESLNMRQRKHRGTNRLTPL